MANYHADVTHIPTGFTATHVPGFGAKYAFLTHFFRITCNRAMVVHLDSRGRTNGLLDLAGLAFKPAVAVGSAVALGPDLAERQGLASTSFHCPVVAANGGCARTFITSDPMIFDWPDAIRRGCASVSRWSRLALWNAQHQCAGSCGERRCLVV